VKKVKKTANELAELIAAEIPMGDALLAIQRDPSGWNATVYASSPDQLARLQQPVGVVVDWLRNFYDLDAPP